MGSESDSTHNENFSVQIQELSDQEGNPANLSTTEQGTYYATTYSLFKYIEDNATGIGDFNHVNSALLCSDI